MYYFIFNLDSLIGDTNLFLTIDPDTDECIAEAEIMIAEPLARGKHYGWEAMLIMLKYGFDHLKCKQFIAKISYSNVKSIRMFEKMQFKEISRSDVFQEITFERLCSSDWIDWVNRNVQCIIENYAN